jgi:catechol 2,3-dioxygenase-like lactoylglutathione lyase family enzyme
MQILALTGLVLPAADPAAARRWYAETLGLQPDEDGELAVGDVAVTFGPSPGLRFVAVGLPDGSVAMSDPHGTVLELGEPDYEEARRNEQHIRDFVAGAEDLAGPPVEELTAATAAVLRRAGDELAQLMTGVAHNKVLATQLALSQQAREAPAAQPDWSLHAASTLLSALVIAGAR